MFLVTEAGVRQQMTINLLRQCLSTVSTVPTMLSRLFNLFSMCCLQMVMDRLGILSIQATSADLRSLRLLRQVAMPSTADTLAINLFSLSRVMDATHVRRFLKANLRCFLRRFLTANLRWDHQWVHLEVSAPVATFLAATFLHQVTDLVCQDRRPEVASLLQDQLLWLEEEVGEVTTKNAGCLHPHSRRTQVQDRRSNNGYGRWQLGQD